jgi:hypothetical protein
LLRLICFPWFSVVSYFRKVVDYSAVNVPRFLNPSFHAKRFSQKIKPISSKSIINRFFPKSWFFSLKIISWFSFHEIHIRNPSFHAKRIFPLFRKPYTFLTFTILSTIFDKGESHSKFHFPREAYSSFQSTESVHHLCDLVSKFRITLINSKLPHSTRSVSFLFFREAFSFFFFSRNSKM